MRANGSGNRNAKRFKRIGQTYPVRILKPNGGETLHLVRVVSPVEQRIRFWKKEQAQGKLFTTEIIQPLEYRKYIILEKLIDGFMTTTEHTFDIADFKVTE